MAREGLMDDCGYNFDVDETSYNNGFEEGFLKAIEEFAEKLKECVSEDGTLYAEYIDEIAEQLKEE